MNKTVIKQNVTVKNDKEQLKHAIRSQYKQTQDYKAIFKDGMDTENRNFNLSKYTTITFSDNTDNNSLIVEFHIHSDKNAEFIVKLSNDIEKIVDYNENWLSEVLDIKNNDELKVQEKKDATESQHKVLELIYQ